MSDHRSSGVRSGRRSGFVRSSPAPRAAAASQRSQQVEQSSNGMYSDQIGVTGSRKRPIRERLHGIPDGLPSVGRQSVNKRQRQDDGKWKHDLYDDEDGDDSGVDNSRTPDLRSRLTRKNPLRSSQGGSGAVSGPVKDLREKLSGPIPAPTAQAEKRSYNKLPSVVRASTASASVAPSRPVIPRSNPLPPKAPEQNVASFLTSLGLDKYLLTFQAEEVDMQALRHMRDEDLKELNVPMGPRKKILLALSSSRT